MQARNEDLRELIGALSPDVKMQMKITWKNTVRGGAVTGGCTVVGGLVAGPVGLAVGGIIGGFYSWLTSEEFKPLPQILMEMTPAQREELFQSIMAVLGNLRWETAAQLIAQVEGTLPLKEAVINVLIQEMIN